MIDIQIIVIIHYVINSDFHIEADIEGSKSNVAMNAWLPQASYPTPRFAETTPGPIACQVSATVLSRFSLHPQKSNYELE